MALIVPEIIGQSTSANVHTMRVEMRQTTDLVLGNIEGEFSERLKEPLKNYTFGARHSLTR